MMRKNRALAFLAVPALMGVTALAGDKPNFTGTWEVTRIERSDGMRMNANGRETQIWVHQEPKLNIKIKMWDQSLGFLTVELDYTIGGQPGTRINSQGAKDSATGTARWEGNRLVYEQNIPNPRKDWPRRIIRTCELADGGSKMVCHEAYWLAGEDQRRESTWYWDKKSGTP
jgi:hypothetical protein